LLPFIAAFILGLTKAGFKGLGFFVVVLLAIIYDAKASTGILMPLLILADIMAITYYKKHVHWDVLWKLLPVIVIGILIGVIVGDSIPIDIFKNLMATIILISGISMFVLDKIDIKDISDNKIFSWTIGLATGFTTMVGNLAGGFANLYFLTLKVPKNIFIGTSAWLFFFVNLIKLPFHVFVWGTVNTSSFQTSLNLAPSLIIGFLCGIYLVKFIPNGIFRKYIIVVTIIGAILILCK